MTESAVSEGDASTSPAADVSMEDGDGARWKGEVVKAKRKKRKENRRKLLSKKRKIDSSQVSDHV